MQPQNTHNAKKNNNMSSATRKTQLNNLSKIQQKYSQAKQKINTNKTTSKTKSKTNQQIQTDQIANRKQPYKINMQTQTI